MYANEQNAEARGNTMQLVGPFEAVRITAVGAIKVG